jgi:hypothetical protein
MSYGGVLPDNAADVYSLPQHESYYVRLITYD